MIQTALFTGGKFSKVANGIAPAKKSSFRWIYASNPNKNETEKLAKEAGIQKNIFSEYYKEPRSRKYASTPLQFVIVDYYIQDKKITKSRVLFILTENTLLTVMPTKSSYYDKLFDRVVEDLKREKNITITLGTILYQFLEEDTEDNYDVLHANDEEIIRLEEAASNFEGENIPTAQIVKFKRELFKMSRRFWSSAKIIFLLRKGLTPVKLDDESKSLLDNTYDTFVHQLDMLSNQQEMLSDIITIYTTKVSNEINRRVKKLTYITLVLTGLALVISIPNTVATIFGIPFLPHEFLASKWEYIVASLVLSTILSIGWLLMYWQKHGVYKEKS